jgi:hypothetical protein
MPLSNAQIGYIAVGAAGVLLIAYFAHLSVPEEGKTQPRYDYPGEIVMAGLSAEAMEVIDTGDHYFHPNMCHANQGLIFLPHRYPTISGANITTLIHRGLTPLRRQAPQDADWIFAPPGENMW